MMRSNGQGLKFIIAGTFALLGPLGTGGCSKLNKDNTICIDLIWAWDHQPPYFQHEVGRFEAAFAKDPACSGLHLVRMLLPNKNDNSGQKREYELAIDAKYKLFFEPPIREPLKWSMLSGWTDKEAKPFQPKGSGTYEEVANTVCSIVRKRGTV